MAMHLQMTVPANERSWTASTAERAASELARKFADHWAQGDRLDAAMWVAEHDPLRRHRSFALDVAYEEFCRRTAAGEQIDSAAFCRRFPEFHSSLYRLLSAHRLLIDSPWLAAMNGAVVWPQVGDELPGLRLLDELGRGAFARVFLAAEPELNRRVAVKCTRFAAAEAEILGSLDHPGIVPVHYVRAAPAGGLSLIVMPYRSRTTLAEILDRLALLSNRPAGGGCLRGAVESGAGPVEGIAANDRNPPENFVDAAAQMGAALTDALAYAHDRGICHCDIKPSNILIDPAGRPMLIDFNLSWSSDTIADRLGGTLPYMPPELIQAVYLDRSPPSPPDPRSDLFSLGVVLYELLTGRHPFKADELSGESATARDFGQRLWERQQQPPARLEKLDPRIDRDLSATIARCLAFSADERPASAAALLAEFQRRDRTWPRWRRLAARRKKLTAGIGSAVLACALTLAAWGAAREPWPRREFRRGAKALAAARFDEAIGCFRRALDADPASREAHFGLALAYQRQGENAWALREYQLAREKSDDPRLLLGAAYCAALDDPGWGKDLFAELIDERGYVTAEVLADRGYCLWRSNHAPEAIACWDQALLMDDRLQVVYYDRALCEFFESVKGNRSAAPSALADIQRAIEIGPDAVDLHLDAARIICRSGEWDDDRRVAALTQIKLAVALGADPPSLAKDPLWPQLHGDPDLTQLASRPPVASAPPRPLRIYDPLREVQLNR